MDALEKAVVKRVEAGSIAEEAGVQPGDVIAAVNGEPLLDILDFKYRTADDTFTVEVHKKNGDIEELEICNDFYEQFGVEFENPLIDQPRRCRNKCIFCFMDQLPPHVRPTMLFKDDDVRLSFLQGNYVTLTNLDEAEMDRLTSMRVSPLNISVHTTDPALRCKMLGNRFAGNIMELMGRFRDHQMMMNAQIVLCPDINDGAQLDRTVHDLATLMPYIGSVSVVPVGLSKHRDGLYPLKSFDAAGAAAVIRQAESWQAEFFAQFGTRLVYLADEFYLVAGEDIPPFETYEDFPQIENGVGLIAALREEIEGVLKKGLPGRRPRPKAIATGVLAAQTIRQFTRQVQTSCMALDVMVYPIVNNFFGEYVTVTGLVCGSDIIAQLKGKPLGEELLLCDSMLKDGGDLFLDDTTVADVERALGVPVRKVANDGADFVTALLE